MKKIYIVLTYTGTNLSKIIKMYTGDKFSHASIALDEELKQMYSFGRLNPYNPFFGGFVHEDINSGTFGRFKKTKSAVYSLEVEDEEYEKMQEIIKNIEEAETPYGFNTIGLFAVALKLRIQQKNSFYCAEFVKHVLEKSGIETNLPEIIRPDDFKKLENLTLEYEGKFREYKPKQTSKKQNDFRNELKSFATNCPNIINEIQINGIRGIEECAERG